MITKKTFKLNGYNGKPISGDITCENNKQPLNIVLFIHGFKGFKDWGAHNIVANYFAKQGFTFIKFNFSHSGVTLNIPNDVTDFDTFAENNITKELFDINVVLNYVQENFGNNIQINVIGHSRGGGLSIIKTAEDSRIKKLITWSAINDFSSLWNKEQESEWLKTGKIFVTNARTKEQMPLNSTLLIDFKAHSDDYNILTAAKKIAKPWLIVHGTDDVNVPITIAEKLNEANKNSKLITIKGANHVYGASHPYKQEDLPELLKIVCEESTRFFLSIN